MPYILQHNLHRQGYRRPWTKLNTLGVSPGPSIHGVIVLTLKTSLHSKLKGITHHSYGSRERATPDLGLLYMITREYLSVCTERNLAPSTEVADWQNTTFFTAVSDSLRGSESDGQKLAKYLNEMPILGSFGK